MGGGLFLGLPEANADLTDIASGPMATASDTVVKPNILFILDDSGSMDWLYLPDSVSGKTGSNCFKNHLYNRIYYNPSTTYIPPVDASGNSYPNASFTAAKQDGFDSSSTTTNLESKFKAHGDDTAQQAYYYVYSSTGTPAVGTCYTNTKYTKVTVSASSAEAQNFANWYSYYRRRMLMMKTAAGLAFKSIGSSYRVGFTTISYADVDSSNSKFLKIADFDATQKAAWYSKLYASDTPGWTPLRAALSKAGRIYAGQLLTGDNDPVQYSCQQNFTILSTDGYWNTNDETSTYGPKKIDGSTDVGNQDAYPATPLSPDPMGDQLNKSNTLADVAMYYYKTDLRPTGSTGAGGADVSEDNVTGNGSDSATWQHMTTFTLGLGVNGTLQYSEDYLTGGSTDYNALRQGTKKWPDPIGNSGGQRIDDLWHAAVNGRGIYFSASDPESVVGGLAKALAGVSARTGAASSAATSNLELVSGDNFVYQALYRTVNWDGELVANKIDGNTGEISDTIEWAAQSLLDGKGGATADSRTIYTFKSDASNKLKSFTWASLTAGEKAYFENKCTGAGALSQCSSLEAADLALVTGENIVNFLRGQNGYEDQADNTYKPFRDRQHILGDMINSTPVYAKALPSTYADSGHAAFNSDNRSNRTAIVYVAANDGMLHAFNGTTGSETWAYVPTFIMPNLYKLADKNYANNHTYYVDGSPTVADVYFGGAWKTILVGGTNAGGRGYYALDVTTPTSPKALWEFKVRDSGATPCAATIAAALGESDDCDLGYSFTRPIVTKRPSDGKWIVAVASGYNNVSPGDGKGYLYLLDAESGTILEKIGTNVGTETSPSGLAKINVWVDSEIDNTGSRFYGGDLEGNLWRFKPGNSSPIKLAALGNADGAGVQPITTTPELAELTRNSVKYPVVYVGTGRYLGTNDLDDTSKQSLYAIKDKPGDATFTGHGLVRGVSGGMVKQSLTSGVDGSGVTVFSYTNLSVDWASKNGWYVDFSLSGERMNVDMDLQYNVLAAATNIPNSNACTAGGNSVLYFFPIYGYYGEAGTTLQIGAKLSGNALVAGIKFVKLTSGKLRLLSTCTSGDCGTSVSPPDYLGAGGARRVSWRELLN